MPVDHCDVNPKRVLVTGCYGFIGSAFIRMVLQQEPMWHIVGFGRDTSQANKRRLSSTLTYQGIGGALEIRHGDLARPDDLAGLCDNIDYVIHFAAGTFVDFSIRDPYPFIQSNVVGTYNLLEQARKSGVKKFVYISTDEVYGAILDGAHSETSPLNPSNPYSATKAAGEALALSYQTTYKLPVIITRTENNHGPYQGRYKALPVFTRKALCGEPLPVYGDGLHERMWLHVDDHCQAVLTLVKSTLTGIYNVAGSQSLTNIELAQLVLTVLDKPMDQVTYVDDHNIRPGHDRRYALDCSKLKQATGWQPRYSLHGGLRETILWYRNNLDWLA